jgi:K+-transporting ATPase ATPase A chain
MVGRTPELFGKKLEPAEVKIAALVFLLHPLLIIVGTAIASSIAAGNPDIGWLANPSFHGFSEMLYEFTSSSANNGSGFEGLGDNTPFWNLSTGIVMLLARFLPIIGPIMIATWLAAKPNVPETSGTLQLHSTSFGTLLFAVIMVLSALAFFPALALGPLAEYFSI